MPANSRKNEAIGVFDSGLGGLTVVRELMRQLPFEQRASVLLREFEEMSHLQISQVLGAKENTVKSWILRGKRALYQRLKEQG